VGRGKGKYVVFGASVESCDDQNNETAGKIHRRCDRGEYRQRLNPGWVMDNSQNIL
jgi:hypothetical protein